MKQHLTICSMPYFHYRKNASTAFVLYLLFSVFQVQSQSLTPTFTHPDVSFEWGIASYAFRQVPYEEVLTVAQKLDVHQIAVKSMHLPLDATDAQIEEAKMLAKKHGVNIYGGAVIYMKTEEEVRQAFTYADKVGMKVIIGVPNPELMDICEKMVKKYDIKLAVHNHGSRNILYPDAGSAYALLKDRDERMGLCIDIGHTIRLNIDPAEEVRKYAKRIHDIQIWESTSATHGGVSTLPGYGVVDFRALLQALIEVEYDGVVSVEAWKDPKSPELGTAYTLGYLNALLTTIPPKNKPTYNQLTQAEKKAGWKLLFDGKSTEGWRGINQEKFPKKGWMVKDGELWAAPNDGEESANGGDIVTKETFKDFELVWEWKMLDKGGNSGLKYYVVDGIGKSLNYNDKYGFGLEYQILDDANHPWMDNGKMEPGDYRTVASLYELYPAQNKKLKPLGTYNRSRILSKGSHVEHWLNGVKVLEYERGSADFREKVAASKFKDVKGYGELEEGHILIQDHGSRVAYRNIKIRTLNN